MSYVVSPNMSLPIPVVGQEPGPDYATDINNSLSLVDTHDHTSGRGVLITTSALNINSSLTFNSNFAVSVAGITMSPQTTTPANNTVYENTIDLYFVDGLGNNIQITQNGGVAGTPGSISNLVSPASASYVSGSSTFVWQSDASVAANMDAGSYLLRNLSPNSTFALTLSPPNGLSSNYQIVLPVLPSSQKIVTLDNNGNMTAPYTFDGTTITTTSNIINVLTVPDNTITTVKIQDAAVTLVKLAPLQVLGTPATAANTTFTVPATVIVAYFEGIGGGGGGGATGTGGLAGGGGGAGAIARGQWFDVLPGETLTVTIGNGGAGGTFAGAPGASGGTTTITGSFGSFNLYGGNAGAGSGGVGGQSGVLQYASGGSGAPTVGGVGVGGAASLSHAGSTGGGTNGGGGGGSSSYASGGAGGAVNSPGGAGGTGGGGGGGGYNTGGTGGTGGSGYLRIVWGTLS